MTASTSHATAKQRIVFMGSPAFAIPTLERLAKTHDVCAVYSQPAKKSGRGMTMTAMPVAQYAEAAGLAVFTPTELTSTAVQAQLKNHQATLFIVVAYGLLLPPSVLKIPLLGCLNGHASLLPRWRGAAPIQRAIEAGDSQTGVAAMIMEAGLDTGPVIDTRMIAIDPEDDAGKLHDKLSHLTASCLGNVVDTAPNSLNAPVRQSADGVTYAAKITSHDAEINWQKPALELDYHIRAFSPYPGAWCQGPRGQIRILSAKPAAKLAATRPPTASNNGGCFFGKDANDAMLIGCADGLLAVTMLQPAGKKPMSATDFLNGARLKIGHPLDPAQAKSPQ